MAQHIAARTELAHVALNIDTGYYYCQIGNANESTREKGCHRLRNAAMFWPRSKALSDSNVLLECHYFFQYHP